ncbi:TerC/Alx family metal homeostasis membrane protein [Portibacter lacus]|uniref:Membrane protein n=1 Tax=Portibacter lacus TaxID=1099794 RepID=A0AA37SLE5_9BACT|nr:TerC/Alx family metal homeostasis membrane protein [Portibacter lacus]GLR16135.1 membrane protein [Portibacter lacus]
MSQWMPWIILIGYVLILLFIDFFVLHKKNEVPSVRQVAFESIFFIANALIFSGLIYWFYETGLVDNMNNLTPGNAIVKYLTGYAIELSLSIDNLFVIAVIFATFKVPDIHQHKLLFLGILGALVFRAILIVLGLVLINKIQGMTFIFGLFLLYTAFKMLFHKDDSEKESKQNWILKLFNISNRIDGGKFRTKVNGKMVFTSLFGALLTIEFTDLLFALDSIPAIFAVTTDPFIVYSSNIFAIMGLRSMYFFLSKMLDKFAYLKYSVFVILLFVAVKLMAANYLHFPEWVSLAFIGLSLASGVIFSLVKNRHNLSPH